MTRMSQVICYGEVLWDLLPTGPVVGGAPMNAAFQLNQLGISTGMISRVGNDKLGDDLVAFLGAKNVPLHLLQVDHEHQTGIVQVTLDKTGSPSYEIVEDVAWDYIQASQEATAAVKAADFFVFGTLVARSKTSLDSLRTLMHVSQRRVLDVNLRAPFFNRTLVDDLLSESHVVKMNDDELDTLCEWFAISGGQNERIQKLRDAYNLDIIAVTRGAYGAVVHDRDGIHSHIGYQVEVQDTIGSGDAFLAGFLTKLIKGGTAPACLDFACKMGAYVATQKGGTTDLDLTKVDSLFSLSYPV